jgi:multidrug efflux pump subunit AcrB
MNDTFFALQTGLAVAVLVILLLLTANFQSIRLAFVVLCTVPAVLTGVTVVLFLTGTTLNVQSFIGAIMAVGVGVANTILVVAFAENNRLSTGNAQTAAISGATSRLRPILMTSSAMIAGMVPMALALGEGSDQTAPLGRAVIGGLLASTVVVLGVIPVIYAIVQRRASNKSSSVHPEDVLPKKVTVHQESS